MEQGKHMSESHTFVRLEGLLTSLHCLAKLTVDLAKEYHDDWCSTERKEEYILERFNDKIQDLEATLQIIKQLSTRETTSLLTTDDTTMAVETHLRRKNTEILPSNETIDISSSEDSFSSEELKPPPERRSETSRCQQQDESLFRLTKCRLYSHETEQRVNHVTEGDTVSPIACETASRVIQLTTADSIPPPFNFVSGCSQDQCSSKEIISNLSTASSFKDTDGNNSMAGTVSYVTRLRPTKQSVVKTSGVRRVFGSSQRKRKMSDPNPIDLLSIMKYKHRRTPSTVVEPNIVRMIDAPCVEFEKSFRTNEPLGAYFVTERVDGRNICKIISLQLGGQAGVDVEKRIRVGTIVDSVIIGACRDPIRTFQELKRKYSKAKEAMTIVFKNHETTVPENPFAVDTSWSYDGRWQGGNLGGWAGGAEDPWVMDSGASHWIH